MAQHAPEDVIREIAERTQTSPEKVAQMYQDTLTKLGSGAKVFDYVPVLVARRVRDDIQRLRQQSGEYELSHDKKAAPVEK